jgi:methionyl-tRNA formyltransferase
MPRGPLRTVFCTRGGYFGALVLERLCRSEAIELCAIVRSDRILDGRFGFLRGALALIGRCGLRYALYLWCATTLADLARRDPRVPHYTTRDLNSPAGLEFLERCAPDLLVSAFFDQRLGAPTLAVPKLGAVNIHPSLLPEFRGVDPVVRARLARASSLGVTVHWMTPGLDEGAVLAQRTVALEDKASVFEATAALFSEGAELLARSLERIARHDAGLAQRSPGSYQSWPGRREIRALRRLGVPLLRVRELPALLGKGPPRAAAKSSAAR